MSSEQQSWVVRVRIPRANAWPSKPMTRGEAVALASSLRDLVRDEGDAAGFVEFEAHGGRVIHVRAREVLSVEVDQWRTRPIEVEGATSGTFGGQVTIHATGPVESGTAFLRQQMAAQRSPR